MESLLICGLPQYFQELNKQLTTYTTWGLNFVGGIEIITKFSALFPKDRTTATVMFCAGGKYKCNDVT